MQQQQQQLEQQQQQQKFLEHQQQQKLIDQQQQQKLLEQQQKQKLIEQQQNLIDHQQQQVLLDQQKAQQQSQTMDQLHYQQQQDHMVYQQIDQAQLPKQHQSFKIQNVQNVDMQQYHQAQNQNAQAVSLQYQNSMDQGKLPATVQYQNVEQSQLQYQQSVEQPPIQFQQSSQAHVINQQQSADQGPIVYQQAVDPSKIHYQSTDQPQVIYQAVEPGGVQQLQYQNGNNVPVQQYQQQPHQQQTPESTQTHLQNPGVGQQQTAQVLSGGVQPALQPVIQALPQHLQHSSPAQQQQQYHQQQLHLVPLQQVPEALHGLSCIQQVQPVHEMIKEEQTGQLMHVMGGVGVHEARVLESEELARAVEEKPMSQIMPEPVHPMVKKIQEIQSMPPQGMPTTHNIEAGYDTSQPAVDPKNLAVDVPSMATGGSYLSPGSVGASGTSGYNSQQSTVTSEIGVSSDPISTIAGQERDKVSCVSSDFDPLCSACPPTAPRPPLKLDTVASKVGVTPDDPHYPTHTAPGWVTAPIIFTPDLDGVAGRESRRGSLPVAQPGAGSLLYPQPPLLSKPHSADTSPNPKCLSASGYSNLSLKLPFPSQSLRRRSADPSDLYRSRQTHHRHISGSTSPTSEELLTLPLLEQRRASGGSALLSPLWEQLPGHSCLLMSCPHSNCSSQSNMANMLTIREVMSMTSSQTSLASTQVLKMHIGWRHPTTLCSPTNTPCIPLTLQPHPNTAPKHSPCMTLYFSLVL